MASIGGSGQSGIPPGGCEYRAVYGDSAADSDGGILFPVPAGLPVQPEKEFFKTALVLPVAVPAASVVLLWRMVFCEQGIINELFSLQTDWIYGPASFSVLIFAYLWKNTGYQMLLWLAALGGISDELYEAAEVDGAGWLQKLLYITIPQVRKAAGMILFLAVINSFKVFREAYIVAGSYPNDRIYLLQHLFNHWFLNLDVQKMCAAAVLLTIVIGIFLIPFVIRAGGDE